MMIYSEKKKTLILSIFSLNKNVNSGKEIILRKIFNIQKSKNLVLYIFTVAQSSDKNIHDTKVS